MNKIDKEHYKCLKAISHIPRNKYDKFRTKNIKGIKGYMRRPIWSELRDLGYVDFNPDVKYVVTKTGLEQLRMLEDIRRKESTLVISILAILISIVSFAKSMGWI